MAATTLESRTRIYELCQEGRSDRQIAVELKMNRHTVRKWRRRSQRCRGTAPLHKMGRKVKGAMSTFPAEIPTLLRDWWSHHPGWGPKTLRAELKRAELGGKKKLPSVAVITRWLKQEELSRHYEKHQALPMLCLSPVQSCHEEWEMDACG